MEEPSTRSCEWFDGGSLATTSTQLMSTFPQLAKSNEKPPHSHLSYLYFYDNCATNQTTRSRLYLSPGRNVSRFQCEIEVQHVLETFNTYPADCWSQKRAFTISTGLAEKPTPTKLREQTTNREKESVKSAIGPEKSPEIAQRQQGAHEKGNHHMANLRQRCTSASWD